MEEGAWMRDEGLMPNISKQLNDQHPKRPNDQNAYAEHSQSHIRHDIQVSDGGRAHRAHDTLSPAEEGGPPCGDEASRVHQRHP